MLFRVGTLIASAIRPWITSPDSTISLKWPNDILINKEKVCGVLIEMENDYMLIGIGCNVRTAPTIDAQGKDAGRSSTAICLHNTSIQKQCEQSKEDDISSPFHYHKVISIAIFKQFEQWLNSYDNGALVIEDFSRNMDFNVQQLRDSSIPTGENKVQPIRLNDDGTLEVRYLHNDSEGTLVADYLW